MRGPLFTKMEQDRAGLQAMAVPRAHEMQRVEESRYSTTQVSDGGYTTVFETVSHDLLSISLDLGDALGLRRQSLRGMICCRPCFVLDALVSLDAKTTRLDVTSLFT